MIAVIIIILIIIIYLLVTYIMFLAICKKRNKPIMVIDKHIVKALEPYQKFTDKRFKWYEKQPKEDIFILSNDNIQLHGTYIEHQNSKGIIIESHGYRSNIIRDVVASCEDYYELGYGLLLIDSRTSMLSGGKYITFGIKESDDLLCWIKYVNNRYPGKEVILTGVSMGATTVLMALKDINKKMNVKCAIVDCAYACAYDEVAYTIKHYFHINTHIFLPMVNIWCNLIAHFNLKAKETTFCLKKCKTKILFVHGTTDDFVPSINTMLNYNKYKGPKDLLLVKNASHGMSFLVDHEAYIGKIKTILK